MRTERNKDGTWNVWMTRDEYREIPRHAHSGLAEVAIRLMGDCGLRVAEVLDVLEVTVDAGNSRARRSASTVSAWGRGLTNSRAW